MLTINFSPQDVIHFMLLATIILQLMRVNRHLDNLEHLEITVSEEPNPKFVLPEDGKGPSSRS